MRKVMTGIAIVFALSVLYYFFNFLVVWRHATHDSAKKSDAIVVLGAAQYNGKPTPVFAARLDKGLELYKEGMAPKVVVSGGKQDADRVTEATAGANYLIARGVPDSAILREVHATNTWEELDSISTILKKRNLNSVILVSDGFHLARAATIAKQFGLSATTAVATESPIRGAAARRKLWSEAAALSAARIVGYNRVYRVGHELEKR